MPRFFGPQCCVCARVCKSVRLSSELDKTTEIPGELSIFFSSVEKFEEKKEQVNLWLCVCVCVCFFCTCARVCVAPTSRFPYIAIPASLLTPTRRFCGPCSLPLEGFLRSVPSPRRQSFNAVVAVNYHPSLVVSCRPFFFLFIFPSLSREKSHKIYLSHKHSWMSWGIEKLTGNFISLRDKRAVLTFLLLLKF